MSIELGFPLAGTDACYAASAMPDHGEHRLPDATTTRAQVAAAVDAGAPGGDRFGGLPRTTRRRRPRPPNRRLRAPRAVSKGAAHQGDEVPPAGRSRRCVGTG